MTEPARRWVLTAARFDGKPILMFSDSDDQSIIEIGERIPVVPASDFDALAAEFQAHKDAVLPSMFCCFEAENQILAEDKAALAKRVEELEADVGDLVLCHHGLKHWAGCRNNAIINPGENAPECARCQRDRALAVVDRVRKLRVTDEWFDLEDALAAFDKGE